MKTISLLLTLFLACSGLAQTLDSTMSPSGSESLDGQFANPTNLSDQKMKEAKDFVHKGIKDRVYNDGCARLNDCRDDEGFPVEMLIGKAYAMLGMFTADGGMISKINAPASEATINKAKKANEELVAKGGTPEELPKTEKKTDYCAMIALANETLGTLIQQAMQKQADNSTAAGDEQLQALLSLRETHRARQKSATFQGTVYSGITACYGIMLASGKAVFDANLGIKMGGAAALTYLYWKKVDKEKRSVRIIDEVIKKLATAGKDCNPWTKTACFCSEMTSKKAYPSQYEEVCVLNKGNFETPRIALGCVSRGADGKQTYDKECQCRQTNSCVRAGLNLLDPKFGLGTNMINDANKAFDMINKGDFDEGELRKATLGNTAFVARMRGPAVDKIKAPNLSDDQKKVAEALALSMPANIAANGAALPTSNFAAGRLGGTPASLSKLPPALKSKVGEAISGNYRTSGGNDYSKDSEPDFAMPQFGQQVAQESTDSEDMAFAEQALSQADVSNAPTTPIFDIISNRYRKSGWTKLEHKEVE